MTSKFRNACVFQLILAVSVVFAMMPAPAQAVPNLQIYIPGATYDTETETWVIEALEYDLWVVGANQPIFDVKAAFAAPTDEDGSITITWLDGSATVPSYIDNTTVISKAPSTKETIEEGSSGGDNVQQGYFFEDYGTPVMGDGDALPPHGVFPSSFYEYYIGDFGTSETVQNYIPGDTGTAAGEIKKFHIQVSGYSWVDIVAYDHVVKSNEKIHSVFSPFSHDGDSNDGGGTLPAAIPEPATILLLGTGLMALGLGARKRFGR